jgi:hypothetical protein
MEHILLFLGLITLLPHKEHLARVPLLVYRHTLTLTLNYFRYDEI